MPPKPACNCRRESKGRRGSRIQRNENVHSTEGGVHRSPDKFPSPGDLPQHPARGVSARQESGGGNLPVFHGVFPLTVLLSQCGLLATSQRQPARSVTSGHVSEILVSAFCVRAANSWQAELLAAAAGSGRAVGGRGC